MEKRNNIVAVDPGSGSITIAVGSQDEDGKLLITDIITRPIQGITRGEITNRQQVSASVGEAVREVEQKLNIRVSDVYTGVSGRHIKCTNHEYFVPVGERSNGEIRSEDVAALRDGMNNVQAEDGIRIMERIPQCYVIDGRETVKDPVGMYGRKLETTFNFVLGSSTMIERLETTLRGLGVTTRKTYANALASAEAVTLPEEKEMGTVVIDIGVGTTDLCIWHDNAVRYVRGIPMGADDINRDIHQQGILEKHVEGLKKKFGAAVADGIENDKLITIAGRSPRDKQEISQKSLAIIIENRLMDIINFVRAEIDDSGYAGRLRGGIVLTGGSAQLAGIDELFRRETGMDVRIALPDVMVSDESVAAAHDPANSTVIGILLKAMAEGRVQRTGTYSEPQRPLWPGGGYEQPVAPPPVPPKHKPPMEPPTGGSRPGRITIDDDNGFDEDDIETVRKDKWWDVFFKSIGKKVSDNIFPDSLDGDEEI